MARKADQSIGGHWTGRLVDVQGFEGTVVLDVEPGGSAKEVRGAFAVEIGVNHGSSRARGQLKGSLRGEMLSLAFETDADPPFRIVMDGQVRQLRPGGLGLAATYSVDGRSYSPLQGGILCASKGQPETSVAMGRSPAKVEHKQEPHNQDKAPRPARGRARRSKS